MFTDAQLSTFNAIVFLNTTLDVLDDNQQIAMERFIQAGGVLSVFMPLPIQNGRAIGFGIVNWVGAVFKSHPNEPSNVQLARVNVTDKTHLATESLPETYEVADEWYNYRDFYQFNKVLMTVDESSYHGGEAWHLPSYYLVSRF